MTANLGGSVSKATKLDAHFNAMLPSRKEFDAQEEEEGFYLFAPERGQLNVRSLMLRHIQ